MEEKPMHDWESLSHVRWDCKYHVVIVPKYRKRALYGKIKRDAGAILRDLARQKGIEIIEGHLMPDHVHMCLKIPPKYSVAFALGFMKGKSAVRIHRRAGHKKVTGMHFWSRGYCVSTVGLDEEAIKKYIREQEKQEKDQLNLYD
jgi:putative transposase